MGPYTRVDGMQGLAKQSSCEVYSLENSCFSNSMENHQDGVRMIIPKYILAESLAHE